MNFADNLKKIRKANGLSQEQLAEKLGISRQAVSKWESGQSYPEMDKVVQICNMFNVNMDDLINDDINKEKDKSEEKNLTNKYIKSFFDYIAKVVDMFSSMKMKQILLCLLEQFVIGIIILMVLLILSKIGSSLMTNLFMLLPDKLYDVVYNIIESIFCFCSLTIGIVTLLYVFKIRYLDYYEIVRNESSELETEDEELVEMILEKEREKEELVKDNISRKKDKIYLEKKKENIIIRDPKHSEFGFISGLAKVIVYFLKFCSVFMLISMFVVLLVLTICCVICFIVWKSGIFFIGSIVTIISGILFSILLIELLYSFIVDRKVSKNRILITLIGSFICGGIGLGLMFLSFKDFKYVEIKSEKEVETYNIEMTDELVISYDGLFYGNIVYEEKDIDGVEIVTKYSKNLESRLINNDDIVSICFNYSDSTMFDIAKKIIEGLNNREILSYNSDIEIYVYARKENLKILQNNSSRYYGRIDELEKQLEKLQRRNDIVELNNEELTYFIKSMNKYEICYDNDGFIVGIKEKYNADEE